MVKSVVIPAFGPPVGHERSQSVESMDHLLPMEDATCSHETSEQGLFARLLGRNRRPHHKPPASLHVRPKREAGIGVPEEEPHRRADPLDPEPVDPRVVRPEPVAAAATTDVDRARRLVDVFEQHLAMTDGR